jgi:hypothetical protein
MPRYKHFLLNIYYFVNFLIIVAIKYLVLIFVFCFYLFIFIVIFLFVCYLFITITVYVGCYEAEDGATTYDYTSIDV